MKHFDARIDKPPAAMTRFKKATTTESIGDISDDDSWKRWFQRYGPKLRRCAGVCRAPMSGLSLPVSIQAKFQNQ
ncbi:MAG: hypothetical protein ABI420_08855 [Opitutaceae bacterium]